MKNKKKAAKKQPEEKLISMLEDYDEVLDLFEDTLLEFDMLHTEIDNTIDDIQDGLEAARKHLSHCRMKLRRFEPVTLINYTEEETPVLPFEA